MPAHRPVSSRPLALPVVLAVASLGLAAVGLLPTMAGAQLPLEPVRTLDTLDGPNDIVLADLDRDGDLDAVAASGPDGTSGTITWWPLDSSMDPPVWGPAQTIDGSFALAQEVLAADLDRDGDLDVVAVSLQADQVAWWENLAGDGSSWSSRKSIASAVDGATAVAVADLDADGDLDVVVAASLDDEVLWLESDGTPGDGGWTTRTVAATVGEASAVAVADVDRDGDLDVFSTARSDDEVLWLERDGASWIRRLVATLDAPRALAVGDLDGDGDPDLAVATATDLFAIGRQGAGWTSPVPLGTLDDARRVAIRDLDRDGDLDLLSAGVSSDTVRWWENDLGGQGFVARTIDAGLDGARGVAAGDLDRDGDLDLVAAGSLDDSIRWWRADPIGRTASFARITVADDFAESVVAADIDRDGDPDVVGANLWYERQGAAYVPHLIDTFAGLGGSLASAAVADIDRDGDPDIAGTNGQILAWWENDGTPRDDAGGGLGTSWTRHLVSDGHAQMGGVSIVDLDRDGALDLVAFARSDNEVLWWQSDGTPGDDVGGGDGNSWTERTIDDVTGSPRSALPRDVDRDGDLDVVVIAQLGDVAFWRNDGGGLSWTRVLVGPGLPLQAAVVDLGQDGDLDVLIGDGGGGGAGSLRTYEQLSPGDGTQWAASTQVGVLAIDEPFVNELAAADFDLDGDVDAAAVGNTDRTYWWRNPSAPGGWVRNDLSLGELVTRDLAAFEASGDALPDLLAGTSSAVVLWENRAAQAELLASEIAVGRLEDGVETAVLRLNARTLGANDDPQAEIARLELLLEETPGTPLDGSQASDVLAALRVYEDIDGSGTFDSELDTLIAALPSPSPIAGALTFELPDFTATIGSTSFRSYFLVVETTADAVSQATDSLRLTLRTGASRMENALYDSPLALRSPEDVSTAVLPIEEVLFADGFETGDLSAWSSSP